MKLREDIQARFDEAERQIERRSVSPGGLSGVDNDARAVTINENISAITDILKLLADEIDQLKEAK